MPAPTAATNAQQHQQPGSTASPAPESPQHQQGLHGQRCAGLAQSSGPARSPDAGGVLSTKVKLRSS